MSAFETVARQAAHRAAWLREVAQRLEKDDRLLAAWLVGSLGNGSADELSDIDLVVVIDDSHAEAVLAHSVQEVARFGETMWLREVPGNAPRGGSYVTAGFKSEPLPIAVDWYWQSFSQALVPSDASLLFDKGGTQPSDPPASFAKLMNRPDSRAGSDPGPVPSDADRVAFFWAMVPVAAKYGVREWDEKAGHILRGLEEQIDVVDATGARERSPVGVTSPLQRLRLLIDQMDRLTPTLRARGIPPPDTSYACEFMRLAEDLKEEGWRRSPGRSGKGSNSDR